MPRRKAIKVEESGLSAKPRAIDHEISEFLLHICHDLRTSIRAIRTHAEWLLRVRETPRSSDFEQHLGFIVDGTERIDRLADGLSGYSIALQTEEGSFQPTPLDVMLRTVLARLDKELRDNDATVTHDELPRVTGNPDRLIQLFENLLRNAVRHRGESSPRVHVSVERQAEGWLFTVRDNGPGIDDACLESIFRPFERLRGPQLAGPGLGLAICRAIVERHGGRIWAESKPGIGSQFFFTLPAH
jgi:signal transduction histidine kinase